MSMTLTADEITEIAQFARAFREGEDQQLTDGPETFSEYLTAVLISINKMLHTAHRRQHRETAAVPLLNLLVNLTMTRDINRTERERENLILFQLIKSGGPMALSYVNLHNDANGLRHAGSLDDCWQHLAVAYLLNQASGFGDGRDHRIVNYLSNLVGFANNFAFQKGRFEYWQLSYLIFAAAELLGWDVFYDIFATAIRHGRHANEGDIAAIEAAVARLDNESTAT